MAVRIRLRRMGAKRQPFYRVVVADSRSPRDGRFLDMLGTYNPRAEPVEISIDRDKALRWLEDGAVPTDSARSLLSQVGVWQRYKTGEWPAEPREPRAGKRKPAARRAAEAKQTAEAPSAEPATTPREAQPAAPEPIAPEPPAEAPVEAAAAPEPEQSAAEPAPADDNQADEEPADEEQTDEEQTDAS